MKCQCGSNLDFAKCCGKYISGEEKPKTAEQLMRARYTAYAIGELGFIKATLASEVRKEFNIADAEKWSKQSKWLGLEIMTTEAGGESDSKGVVEFLAKYTAQGQTIEHHETAQFRKDNGEWFFVDGDAHTHKEGEGHHHHHAPKDPVIREQPKVGRNDPCSCGSGKKFKKCCGS